jgi:uncharacterized membrane protein
MKRQSILVFSAFLITTILFIHNAQAADFMGLGDLPGEDFHSQAWAVSADGSTVVGQSSSESGEQAFRWTIDDGLEALGYSTPSRAYGVSRDGSVVVGMWHGAFRWTRETGMVGFVFEQRGCELRAIGEAYDVSDNGKVMVGIFEACGVGGFRYSESSFIEIGFDNPAKSISADGSVVAGYSAWGGCACPWIWTQSGGYQLLSDVCEESPCSSAHGISADGLVVVGRAGDEAYRWTEAGGVEILGDLPGGDLYSGALAASADGSIIVGGCYLEDRSKKAFIWDDENGMRNLRDVLIAQGVDLTGWVLQEATGISDYGATIVGYGTNPNGDTEAWIAQPDGYCKTRGEWCNIDEECCSNDCRGKKCK